MANWCENIANITAPDEDVAQELFSALAAGVDYKGVPNVICSTPNEPADELSPNGAAWVKDRGMDGNVTLDGARLYLTWGSRWQPPISFYEALEATGFLVDALYLETGMCFCGTYRNGEQRNVNYERRADIPAEIENQWGEELLDWVFEDVE